MGEKDLTEKKLEDYDERHLTAFLDLLSVFAGEEKYKVIEPKILEKQKEGKVITMCTVVERFMEEGREEGIKEERQHLVMSSYRKGKTPEEIADFMDIPLEEVEKIIEQCVEKETDYVK